MTAKKTRSLYWCIYLNKVSQYSFELMQSASTMSPFNVIIRPEVSSTSSDASSHVMGLFPKRSIDLDTASLEVESSSVAIDYTYSTWNIVDSVGRKSGPI